METHYLSSKKRIVQNKNCTIVEIKTSGLWVMEIAIFDSLPVQLYNKLSKITNYEAEFNRIDAGLRR